jgi:hypothetical protein
MTAGVSVSARCHAAARGNIASVRHVSNAAAHSAALNLVNLFDAPTIFGAAGTRADRLFRLLDLVQRASSGRNSAAALAAPL